MQKVKEYQDSLGNVVKSMTQSMLAWRKYLGIGGGFANHQLKFDDQGVCDVCHGEELVNANPYGEIRCICAVKRYEEVLKIRHSAYSVQTSKVDIKDIQAWGSDAAQDNIVTMIHAVEDFDEWAGKWLTIAGIPGTGKTHVLQWLARRYGAWSLYMTDTEFENYVFASMEDDSLQTFLDVLKYAPVLLYDDIGSGYGAKFPMATLRRVMDFRYNMWEEYPTAVTTNLKRQALYALDQRIADRVYDQDRSVYVSLNEVSSWRTR